MHCNGNKRSYGTNFQNSKMLYEIEVHIRKNEIDGDVSLVEQSARGEKENRDVDGGEEHYICEWN